MFRFFQVTSFAKSQEEIAKKISDTKNTCTGLNALLINFTDEERIYNSLIPNSRWFSSQDKQLFTFLDQINVNGYRFVTWSFAVNRNQEFLQKTVQTFNRPTISLIYINSKEDAQSFEQFFNSKNNSLIFFVTENKALNAEIPNTILWNPEQNLEQFYGKVIERVEPKNLQKVENKQETEDSVDRRWVNQCRIM